MYINHAFIMLNYFMKSKTRSYRYNYNCCKNAIIIFYMLSDHSLNFYLYFFGRGAKKNNKCVHINFTVCTSFHDFYLYWRFKASQSYVI